MVYRVAQRGARSLVNAVAGPSRAVPHQVTGLRHKHAAAGRHIKPAPKDARREDIEYDMAGTYASSDRLAYFNGSTDTGPGGIGVTSTPGQEGGLLSWGDAEDETAGLEIGRVVEFSRMNRGAIGLILASMLVSGRLRYLVLLMSGETWPISPQDVQFAMPSSLVSPQLAKDCFSPEILQLWASGIEPSSEDIARNAETVEARRKVVAVLRKIVMQTEKMKGKLLGGGLTSGRVGGMDAVWEEWTKGKKEDERGSITSAEAAEWLLNAEVQTEAPSDGKDYVTVRPNTLPAYAAHGIMMKRSELFMADAGDMWETGRMMVRSRSEKQLFERVSQWAQESDEEGKTIFNQFRAKCVETLKFYNSLNKKASADIKEAEHDLPSWTEQELDIISILKLRNYETRATQRSPTIGLAMTIMRSLNVYPEVPIDQTLVAHFLVEMGITQPWDTLETSKKKEADLRSMALSGTKIPGPTDFLAGNELDELREDFTDHKVYIIDDPTASELDDGISLERIPGSTEEYWLHVHVADPTRYIGLEHPLAVQASFRGSSIYLPEGNRPLFPTEIIMKELSLGTRVEKDGGRQGVVTFSARMGSDGSVKDHKVRLGWIKNSRIITYGAVNEIIGAKSPRTIRPLGTPDFMPQSKRVEIEPTTEQDTLDLTTLRDLAAQHRIRRFAKSGMDWDQSSSSVRLVTPTPRVPEDLYGISHVARRPTLYNGTPMLDFTAQMSGPFTFASNSIVAECMTLAGTIAASFCHSRSIPIPYRGCPMPLSISTKQSKSPSVDDLLSQRDQYGRISFVNILKVPVYYPPATLTTTPMPHWIMGLNRPNTSGYTRATSPLRRYDDMLVHWQIKSALAREKGIKSPYPVLNDAELLTVAKRAEAGSKRAKRAGMVAGQWWQMKMIESRLNGPMIPEGYHAADETVDLREPMKAIIMGPTESRFGAQAYANPVSIPGLGISAAVQSPTDKEYEVGQEISVRLHDIEKGVHLICELA